MADKLSRFPAASDGDRQSLVDRLLAIAQRNAKLLAICAVLVPLVALTYSLIQEPRYTASASLLFRDPGLDEKLFGGTSLFQEDDPQRAAATNLKLVSLREISERTAAELQGSGLSAGEISDQVSISAEGVSDLIAVEAEDPDPKLAARLANTFAEQYISFRREADRAKIAEAEGLVQAEIDGLDATALAGPAGQELERRARELKILASLQTGNAELVQAAEPPDDPSSPKTARNLALGIFLGLALGIGLTFAREQLDRRIKDPEEAAGLFDLPILATIPESRAIANMKFGPSDPEANSDGDAFRMLRTNLRYFNVDRDVKSILVTSAVPQDGKTTVSWNLAHAEAEAGARVLYLEGDLRRPSLAGELGVTSPKGLSLVLAGLASVEQATQRISGVDVLCAGPLPPNPAELIDSDKMRRLIKWGEEHYDRVIIDTPPAAVVADAVPLLTEVSGVVIVLRVQHSRRDAAGRLREQLTNTGAPVLGLVINGVRSHARNHYYYGPPDPERLFTRRPSQAGRPSRGNGAAKSERGRQGQQGPEQQKGKQQQQGQQQQQKQQARPQGSKPSSSA